MKVFSLFLILITTLLSSDLVKGPTYLLGSGKKFNAKEWIHLEENNEFTKAFTVEGWFYPLDLSQNNIDVLSHRIEEMPTDFRLFFDKNKIVYGYYSKASNRWRRVVLNNALIKNRWHHIAISKDTNGKVNFYINADRYEIGVGEKVIDTNNTIWTLGCHVNKVNCFKGYLDEIRIWNYARSEEEIKSNFRKPIEDNALILREGFEKIKEKSLDNENNKTTIEKPMVKKSIKLAEPITEIPKEEVVYKPQEIKHKKVEEIEEAPIFKKEENIQDKKRNFFYSVGINMENGTFKNELQNRSGIFEIATINNSSQERTGKGLELMLGTDLEDYKIGGFYNQIKWSNASAKTVGLLLEKEFEKVTFADMNVNTFCLLKAGKTDFSLDKFGNKSDSSYSVSGGIKYQNILVALGYNFIDVDVNKKYAIGGSALHNVNYKGGVFLTLSLNYLTNE